MTRTDALPNQPEMERSVVGACLLDRDSREIAMELLRPEHFYSPAYASVYGAITDLAGKGSPVDTGTVADLLVRRGLIASVGGVGELVALLSYACGSRAVGAHAQIVLDMARLRALVLAGMRIAALGNSLPEDIDAAMVEAEQMVSAASESVSDQLLMRAFVDVNDRMLDEILSGKNAEREKILTGLTAIDDIVGSLERGSLILVGGRPSMGKSVLACVIAMHVSMQQRLLTMFVSIEMRTEELVDRMAAGNARVDHRRLKNRELYEAEIHQLVEASSFDRDDDKLRLLDGGNHSVASIRTEARRLVRERGPLGLLIVDYIQMMRGPGGADDRQREVSDISRGLKLLARELDCPVVAVASLNRGLEGRADKRPILSDLRDSGSLESDADVVIFCFREELYGKTSQNEGVIEFIVAKNRTGPIGDGRAAWLGHQQTIMDFGSGPRVTYTFPRSD